MAPAYSAKNGERRRTQSDGTIRHKGAKMKQVFAVGFLVLAVSACTPQSPPRTTAFDGYYEKPVVTGKSQGCPDLGPLPYVSIGSGYAVFHAPTFFFQGQVTPEGTLSMRTTTGLTFDGQIDPQFVLTANVSGPNCSYHITWTRVS
jgi:hypothetical protein